MAWSAPKTDWDTADGVTDTDLNRIEENVRILGQGNGRASIAEIASGDNLDINDTDDAFLITGTNAIKFIKIGTRQPGDKIWLCFPTTASLHHDEGSPPSGYAALYLTKTDWAHEDAISGSTTIGKFIEFIFDGTYWRSGFIPTA
jgi:hypothetical protein